MTDENDHRQLFDSCINALESCMEFVQKYSDESDKHEQTKYLQTVLTKDYCNIDLNYKNALKAIEKTQNTITTESINPNETVKSVFERTLKKINDDEYATHPVWYRINKQEQNSIEEVENEDSDEDKEYETVDDSMMCSQSKALPLDPITKMAIKNPCKNKKCGHIYEYENIMMYLQRKSKVSRCPYVGCGNLRMHKSQIELNK